MRKLTMTVAAAALLAAPGLVEAQASASVQATANVLAPITVTDERGLAFGSVIPGYGTTVLPGSSESGLFRLTGAGALGVALTFTLPTELVGGASGTSTLPLSFGGGSAGVGTTATAADASFDPSGSNSVNLSGGELFVFIGGTVTPAVAQEAGGYAGTITLAVAYTGS